MNNDNIYFEVELEYPGGYKERLLTNDINIQSGYPHEDNSFHYFDLEPERVDYYGPKVTEIKYKNLWGGTVLMQVPIGAQLKYYKWTGDVWWVEENGVRVSPIWDKVGDVYKERALYPNGKVIVKSFVKEEVEEE